MNSMYSDYERKLIAEKEYDNTLQVDNDIYIETRKSSIGTVRQVIENETGLMVYVVESPDQSEVSVLYEGSKKLGEDEESNLYGILEVNQYMIYL
ncbi:hypothetical protein QM414_05005 [Streptococcus mitis]|uniref:hypothetical protein n=1 Tax=Streptococcus mitis TaxID=28037 RepID=UPI0039C39DFC